MIRRKKRAELDEIHTLPDIFNWLLSTLPNLYYTRCGCEIEDFPDAYPSEHDAVRNIGSLVTGEYNELLLNLYTGSYNSAIRCSRAVLEWLLRSVAAVSDLSILTNVPEDKNKAACFYGLQELTEWSKWKRTGRTAFNSTKHDLKDLAEKLADYPEIQLIMKRKLHVDIRDGIGNIPDRLNESILKYLQTTNSEDGKVLYGKDALRHTYDVLSKHVHVDAEKIDADPHGTQFFDEEKFEETFSTIIRASDINLYLFLLLMDIDVFHSNKDWKYRWRQKTLEILEPKLVPIEKLPSTSSLLKSSEWCSDKMVEFVSN
jgi:hypothetical protein